MSVCTADETEVSAWQAQWLHNASYFKPKVQVPGSGHEAGKPPDKSIARQVEIWAKGILLLLFPDFNHCNSFRPMEQRSCVHDVDPWVKTFRMFNSSVWRMYAGHDLWRVWMRMATSGCVLLCLCGLCFGLCTKWKTCLWPNLCRANSKVRNYTPNSWMKPGYSFTTRSEPLQTSAWSRPLLSIAYCGVVNQFCCGGKW